MATVINNPPSGTTQTTHDTASGIGVFIAILLVVVLVAFLFMFLTFRGNRVAPSTETGNTAPQSDANQNATFDLPDVNVPVENNVPDQVDVNVKRN